MMEDKEFTKDDIQVLNKKLNQKDIERDYIEENTTKIVIQPFITKVVSALCLSATFAM